MFNNWHKKEKPFLSITSLTGGAGGFAKSAAAGLWQLTGQLVMETSQTGKSGPNLTDARNQISSGMPSTAKNDTNFFNVTPTGIRELRVPENGIYEIEATGAPSPNGRGARNTARFDLQAEQVLRIVVGQKGTNSYQGSGGTYVVVYPTSTTLGNGSNLETQFSDGQFLMCMGGAGGSGSYVTSTMPYQDSTNGDRSTADKLQPTCGNNGYNGGGGGGGMNGSGGGGGGLKGNGGFGYGGSYGGSFGPGGDGNNYPPSSPSPGAGGSPGGSGPVANQGGYAFLKGSEGGQSPPCNQQGGMGGGGSFCPWNSTGAGGGGYSGGGGGGQSPQQAPGQGGSSLVNTSSPFYNSGGGSFTLSHSSNYGKIVITKV